jgi:hypothetical protein
LITSILHFSGGRSSVIPSDSIIIISAPENSGDFYKIVKQISGNSSNNTIPEDKYLPGSNIKPFRAFGASSLRFKLSHGREYR